STFLLITISAGTYHTTRIALVIAAACILLGFLPALYATTSGDFWVQQAVLGASALAAVAFQRLVLPEILRRARAEQGLQEDLRETRELRDELARANASLAWQARTDPLTGLLNHGAIVARADGALTGALAAGEALALLFFDIDRFKRVNDTYGHQARDAILAGVAARVAVALRPGDHLGRYGGEEFLVILPRTGPGEAAQRAERLRAAVAAQPFNLPDGTAVRVTISVGVATVGAANTTRAALIHAADLALYQAKSGGRDRVCSLPVAA
ncbi:MAG TPA: GGDEF domain-containing protein, partial [Thermomicrobiales bacterium]